MAANANTTNFANPSLTIDRLKELIEYNPETGEFRRKKSLKPWKENAAPGAVHKQGYLVISVDGKKYKAHRLAWFYVTGEWPTAFIDHIDRNRLNNTFSNLRDTTFYGNAQNRSAVTGKFVGCSYRSKERLWTAQIRANGKNCHLGYFRCETAAHLAYLKSKKLYHHEAA